jgi:hypothetical protein
MPHLQFYGRSYGSCIYRDHLYNTAGETAGVTQDVGADSTVSGTFISYYTCTSCDGSLRSCKCRATCEDDLGGDGMTFVVGSNDEDDHSVVFSGSDNSTAAEEEAD